MTYTEAAIVETIERLAGTTLSALDQTQLDAVDQFHAGGADAVDRLIPALQLASGMTALDVGSGFGGPARQVARTTGCDVVGVDISASYVAAAQDLTRSADLDDRVHFHHVDVADLDRTDFDAAYTIHVQMNVADKKSFYAEIARRLRPGARLATFEVCRAGDVLPTSPLPWSLDGSDSFLATPDELRDSIQAGGFEAVEWVDDSDWVKQWFAEAGRRIAAAGAASANLPGLLDDGPTRMFNFAAALATGAVTIPRGAFVRAR
jgi:sarcosine/dimethylglycine N-methyltransferase